MRTDSVHPVQKTFLETVSKYRLIGKNDRVLVGFSGGPDSVCLLELILSCFGNKGVETVACHVNHMLRGAESDRDEKFTREFCGKKGVRYISRGVDVKDYAKKNKLSLETAARECRYAVFQEALIETGATKIATAHHQDDLAETLLYRVFRGTGVSGLTSIPVKRGNIIRPLLYVSRESILDFVRSKDLEFVTDSTNENDDFDRNYIRKNVMPAIGKRFPAFRDKISDLSRLASDEEQFWDEQTSRLGKYVSDTPDGTVLSKQIFRDKVPEALVRRLVRNILRGMNEGWNAGVQAGLDLIEKTVRFGRMRQGNKTVFRSEKLRVLSSYDSLIFQKPLKSKKLHKKAKYVKLRGKTDVDFGGFSLAFSASGELLVPAEKNDMVFAPGETGEVVLRPKQDGDRIRIKGDKTKKLKEIFIDGKVPLILREQSIVIEGPKGKVVAVYIPERGFRVSEDFYIRRGMKGPFIRVSVRKGGRP